MNYYDQKMSDHKIVPGILFLIKQETFLAERDNFYPEYIVLNIIEWKTTVKHIKIVWIFRIFPMN